jgi:hypothetical protein
VKATGSEAFDRHQQKEADMQATRRDRLTRLMSEESAHGVTTVVKCGACIALLALLTVIGFSTSIDDAVTPVAMLAGDENNSAHVGIRAETHRKQVFDERRARFEGVARAQFAMKPDGRSVSEVTAP